jgi:hypothetical protein
MRAWLDIKHSMGVLASSPSSMSVAESTVQSCGSSALAQIKMTEVIGLVVFPEQSR